MMKTYSIYEASTGLFTGKRLRCDDAGLLEVRLPPGTLAIEGAFDPMRQRVELLTGDVVEHFALVPPGTGGLSHSHREGTAILHQIEDPRAAAVERIRALESSQGRAIREATLGDATAIRRLKEIDAEIALLRRELA